MADDSSQDDLFDSIAADVAAEENDNQLKTDDKKPIPGEPGQSSTTQATDNTVVVAESNPFPPDHPLYMEVVRSSKGKSWEERLAFKLKRLEVLQDRKERHMLTYLNNMGIPDAYYKSWKEDANLIFTLSVRLRKRARKYQVEDQLPKRKSNGYMGFKD